ncbi:tetratricopeptide repeat protein [Nitzschia inconspicua]|uniref:Tetratricopeptide repeat protein n=1 Tax=Nitzschia inconspicua TaxID=303405 RepID=A0A9K3Q824_9STRA|nr:tetratricopeptide repeat protein [Nitzschia inconspicua]
MKLVGGVGSKIVVPGDGEAMQYKDAPVEATRKKKTNKDLKNNSSSALRSSSERSLQKPFGRTKVSFSGDNKTSTKRSSLNSNNKVASSFGRSNSKKASTKPTGKDRTTAISSPPRKWNLGRRFSLFGSTNGADGQKHKNGYGTLDEDLDDAAVSKAAREIDPVMTIFESRNKQRVRFTLEGDVPTRKAKTSAVDKAADVSVQEDLADDKCSSEKHANGGANLKQFMSRALFGSKNSSTKLLEEEMKREVKELDEDGSLVWESARTFSDGPEVVHTHNSKVSQAELLLSFTEDPKVRAAVTKLLAKARRAEHIHFRYEYAVKCYVKAVNILKKAKYPDDHPTVVKMVKLMNNAYHVLSSYHNSANIVKMGIKNEDAGELVKALKMYTIAYRIRRDNLSRSHPSLVVLLNMLGSIQIKRGELKEAMQIYELALNDSPVVFSAAADGDDEIEPPVENLLAKSVTYREMGTIYEMWGNLDEALKFYHKSLDCIADWRETARGSDSNSGRKTSSLDLSAPNGRSSSASLEANSDDVSATTRSCERHQCAIDSIRPMSFIKDGTDVSSTGLEHGEMELVIGSDLKTRDGVPSNSANEYEKFFPERSWSSRNSKVADDSSHAHMDLSLTLHQIAQVYRAQGKYSKALDAFEVALRGMKTALGKHHPNVAAVLGNIGNLQKEMGNLDAAYQTYQEVLGIESYRLGLSHPDVAITLHNIATIDAARGNFEQALQLYRKVIGLQKKLFGVDNMSVAVTAACMGDVYEKIGELDNSIDSFEEAVRVKSFVLGRHSLDVGRLLHKLGKLSFLTKDYLDAESFVSRAILIYRLNKLGEDHQWFVDAKRDCADIDAAIATGTQDTCEI